MPQKISIDDVVRELRETATHMNSLAVLLEKAQQLEDIQSKLNGLFADPNLAKALTSIPGVTHNSQNFDKAPHDAINQASEGLDRHTSEERLPRHTPEERPPQSTSEERLPQRTSEKSQPEQSSPQPETKPVKPVVSTPAINIKHELKRIEAMYSQYGYKITHIAKPMDTWAESKIKAVLRQITVHPDSITDTGNMTNRPWTWVQVNYAIQNYTSRTPESMAVPTGHTAQEIRILLHSLGLTRITPTRTTNSLEKYLPEEVQNPMPSKRLRIYRLMSDMTLDELANRTGIKKKHLVAMENNSKQMTTAQRDKITEALNLERAAMTTMPITDLLSLDDTYDAKSRLKTLRLRFGMTETDMANRMGSTPEHYHMYEHNGPTKEQARRICMSMKVNAKLFESCYVKQDGEETGQTEKTGLGQISKPTSEKLYAMRTKAGLSISDLSRRTGVSISYISQIEKGAHNPSDEILNKLALGMKCTINDIAGSPNLNIRPLKTSN